MKRVLLLFALICHYPAQADINARIEIIEPYSAWFATEDVDFFLRITNIGDADFPIFLACGDPRQQIFFEVDDKSQEDAKYSLNLPNVNSAKKTDFNGFKVPSGQAYVMSDLDYNEYALSTPEAFTRVRVHLLIPHNGHVSSEWVERNIIATPDLDVEPLFKYVISPALRGRSYGIIPLQVNDETWLFEHPFGSGRVGGRLCRVPPGSKLSFEHDLDKRRLKIHFGSNEETVVVNTRTGKPVTGSVRTVPHLHLWKRLAGRPFTDTWQEMDDMNNGKTEERSRTFTTVPALSAVTNPQTQQHFHGNAPTGDLLASQSPQTRVFEAGEKPSIGIGKLWILFSSGGILFAAMLGGLYFRDRKRRRRD